MTSLEYQDFDIQWHPVVYVPSIVLATVASSGNKYTSIELPLILNISQTYCILCIVTLSWLALMSPPVYHRWLFWKLNYHNHFWEALPSLSVEHSLQSALILISISICIIIYIIIFFIILSYLALFMCKLLRCNSVCPTSFPHGLRKHTREL